MSDDHDDLLGRDEPISALAPPRPRPAERRSRPSRSRYRLRRALALFLLVLVGFGVWFGFELYEPFTGGGTGTVSVTIPRGDSARQVGDLLASRGIVSSGFFFNLRAMIDGDRSKLRAGTFTLRHGMSYAAALHTLTTQPPAPVALRVTIPEGFTRAQIAALAAADGLSGSYVVDSRPSAAGFDPRRYGASTHAHTLEGFLFPATYYMTSGTSAKRLVAEQLAAFHANFDPLNFTRSRAAGLTRYDVLTIASIIEREAKVPGDRRLVAAVVYNRLRAGMTLGMESTLRYYLNDWTHAVTASQLALNTPYNTDLHHGLPPTPISNPGLASMVAATNPAHVAYLYFFAKPGGCGRMSFTSSYAVFQADAAAANGVHSSTKCP